MSNRDEVRSFLTSRRGRISPEQAGIPYVSQNRRVAGLRREEVALLAGVSVDYYTRLERGNLGGVSESVLDAIARALQLDEADRTHLFDLANTQNRSLRGREATAQHRVRPSVQRLLDMMGEVPALVRNGRLEVLAANDLGRALYAPVFDTAHGPVNLARFTFLDARAMDFYPEWESVANDTVAILRTTAGANPYDRALTDLVGELSTRSETFRGSWAAHNVRLHRTGTKRVHHPVVGPLELTYESLEVAADPGLRISTYTAPVGSPSQDALRLLASWSATGVQQAAHSEPQDAP